MPPSGAGGADPGEGGAAARARGRIFADLTPFRISADYRRLWFGNMVSWVGSGMTALAISLQVYDLTGSSFYVGLVGIFTLVPLVAFGLYGGAIADTVDRRKLGLYSALGSAVLSAVLSAGTFAGVADVWFLYAVIALQSICQALNGPARSAMIPKLLPPEHLPAANALNSMIMTTGTLVGPMLGGLVVGFAGYRTAYLIDAITFAASLYAMWRLPAMLPERAAGTKRPSVMEGLRFLATRPNLRMTFFSDFCAMILAHPRALFPAVAVLWYGGDARTTGLLVAAPAIGALLGGVFSGWQGRVHRHGLAVLISVGGWGAAIAAFGLTRQLWLGLFMLAVAGFSDTVSMVFRNTMMQVAAPDEMRGRLQGVFIVVVAGGPRLGDFLAGTVADLTSPTVMVVGGGLACVLAVTVLGVSRRSFARYDARWPAA
ncbi:MFS transporter [Streptomyces sp. NBC_00083]|uniref:MFS transporter n=1 Tax=Streptomyces sp. NBC_00083 TaxID=2975647 RepID=UPI00224D3B1B|nr:MFS transporter [Streptomyces sp. NBC_00083]MCX5382645.1 MFS transporter [Streptomyces sp. NBC_00083]